MLEEASEIELLVEDPPCLVVNKPGGILTQGPPGVDSLELRVRRWVQRRQATSSNIYLGVPHRLDRAASGAIVFARHVRAARFLSEQFERRVIRKTYWALVTGQVEPAAGTWRDWMRKIPREPRAELVDRALPDAQQAVLHYRVRRHDDFGSWLEIELETGRMHQIRIQCAARGHAILGDDKYGSVIPFGPPSDDERERWIALHARQLGFLHPKSKAPSRITAPVWSWWLQIRPVDYWTDG
jgi:RluA family pseudouridine synthase